VTFANIKPEAHTVKLLDMQNSGFVLQYRDITIGK
jgi:hypothetical protein